MTDQPVSQFSNSSTLTDICCRADTAEVELVSLIEEHIPHYKLRADTLTEFCGYENEDWYIQTPVLSPDTSIPLSPEVVEETLKYFVLCADRLSQMTKTYNDIDAVTRLLEEKERDLELAARIGQSLLDQNKNLRLRNDQLEQELATTSETITQLRHDLSVKNGLLQIYTQDLETESESGSPVKEKGFSVSWEVLNKKITCLQEENSQLRSEAFYRSADIENEEKKEMQLISDCVRQLSDANKQLAYLQEEVGRKSEDSIRQQEEITQLLSQIVDLQRKLRDMTADNECLVSKLEIAEECQHELSEELIDMKEKYGELMAAFEELQAEVKQAQRTRLPNANTWQNFGMYNPYINPDSLANELEQSLARDSDGYSSDEKQSHSRKVFDTVRYANHGFSPRSRFSSSHSHYTMSGSNSRPTSLTSTCFSSLSQLSSLSSGFNDLASDSESAYAESYSTDDENPETYISNKSERCRPSNLDGLHTFSSGFGTCTDLGSELEKATGEIWTTNLKKSLYRRTVRKYQFPEKLQIIKPLEGSQTLHHWQRLATPHLGGLFESHPGVKIKGETKLKDLDEKVSLGDFEEDEDYSNPGKSFMNTSSVYTFTTSMLQRPNDLTCVTPSYPSLQLCTRITSQPPSNLNSPQQKTSSLLVGGQSLAKLLMERGIHAMVPSAIHSTLKSVSPTPTPAPSPEGSPPSTPLPFGTVRIPDLVGSASIAKGFHLLKKPRRSRSQPPPKRSTLEASAGLNLDLMGRIKGIGLKTLLPTDDCALTKKTASSETLLDCASDTVTSSTSILKANVTLVQSSTSPKKSMKQEDSKKTPSPEIALDKPWGYVPTSVTIVKSPAAIGLTPTVAPPLSRMPNPVLQLNSLRSIRPNCSDIGTVGTLRTLRKGGYI